MTAVFQSGTDLSEPGLDPSRDAGSQIEFRRFDSARELTLQRNLFSDAFPETVGTALASDAHYDWKFRQFPERPPAHEYGAYANGVLIAYYAALPYPYIINGKTYRAAMVCDVMTHSSMRGKGVFTKLGAFAVEHLSQSGLDIAFGYPVRPEVIPGHLKVGWTISGDLPLYVRIARLNSLLRQHSAGALAPLANLLCGIYGGIVGPSRRAPHMAVERLSVESFLAQPGCEELLGRSGDGVGGTLVKTPEFLRWRYGAPEVNYTVLTASKHRRILAAAFVRQAVLKHVPTLAILDLITYNDEQAALSALFRELDTLCAEREQDMLAMMVSPMRAHRLNLVRFGYVRGPFKFQLISRPLSERGQDLATITANDLDPMWVDSDDL